MVATNDVHFTFEDDAEAHDRLICVSMQKKFSDDRLHYTKQEWLKSTKEMNDIFADVPEALATTNEILDKVEFYSIDHGPIMPNFAIPKEFGTEEEYRSRITEQELFGLLSSKVLYSHCTVPRYRGIRFLYRLLSLTSFRMHHSYSGL